jgi:hypothetical protein
MWAILTAYSTINFTHTTVYSFNPLNAKLNPICRLLVLLGARPILHIIRIRVNVIEFSFKMNNFVVWDDRFKLRQVWKLKNDMGNGGGWSQGK